MASVHDQTALAATDQLAEACQTVLSGPVKAAILHGSLTLDDFVPGQSDIDLMVIVDHSLSQAEMDALEALVRDADLGGASGFDLHVIRTDVAASPSREPGMELHVGRYPGIELEVEPKVSASPDLLPEMSMARERGRSLFGAEPKDAIGPIPHEWVVERGRHWIGVWQGLTDDTRHAAFMVLTTCRIWRFAVEGVHSSKADAGRWALARDASLVAVTEALHQRAADPSAPVGEDGIKRLLDIVQRELEALR